MSSAEAKLAKELLDVFLDLFPLGSAAKRVIKLPVSYLLDRADGEAKAKSVESIVSAIATELSEMPDQSNLGAARSAAHDVVRILRDSKLGPELLIQLNLDPDLVFSHLMKVGSEAQQNASGLRRGFIEIGLRKIAYTIVEYSPDLPGVRLAFMQALLKARNNEA